MFNVIKAPHHTPHFNWQQQQSQSGQIREAKGATELLDCVGSKNDKVSLSLHGAANMTRVRVDPMHGDSSTNYGTAATEQHPRHSPDFSYRQATRQLLFVNGTKTIRSSYTTCNSKKCTPAKGNMHERTCMPVYKHSPQLLPSRWHCQTI